jgi:hypothetical protein
MGKIVALFDRNSELYELDVTQKKGKHMKTGCETHTNVTFSEPFCPICMLNERDALRARIAELTMPEDVRETLTDIVRQKYQGIPGSYYTHSIKAALDWLQKGAK